MRGDSTTASSSTPLVAGGKALSSSPLVAGAPVADYGTSPLESTPKPRSGGAYRADIDGLRAVAVLGARREAPSWFGGSFKSWK